MAIFTLGNAACALAPNYDLLMAARVLTAFAHGTFFGVGSVVATGLVAQDSKASAIAIMFTGLTIANILGVPFGTWLGQQLGWRATFWAVTVIGVARLRHHRSLRSEGPSAAGGAATGAPTSRPWRARRCCSALLTTVLGYAGVFAVFTYIAPMLTEITGFPTAAGLADPARLRRRPGRRQPARRQAGRPEPDADRARHAAGAGGCAWPDDLRPARQRGCRRLRRPARRRRLRHRRAAADVGAGKRHGAGQSLASSLNIAAFNLGNALGAWAGGAVIDHGPGLAWVPLVATLFPLAALGVAMIDFRRDRLAPVSI